MSDCGKNIPCEVCISLGWEIRTDAGFANNVVGRKDGSM